MAEQTTTPAEPTIRDVLLQIDRRLTRVEDDLRAGIAAVSSRIEAVRGELGARIDGVSARIEEVRTELSTEIASNFRWTVGLILATWITTIGTILLK